MTSAETIARALGGHRCSDGYLIRCPVPAHGRGHGDRRPSLLVKDGDSTILVKCFAGCDARDILDTLRHRRLLDDRANHDHDRGRVARHRRVVPPEPEPDPQALEVWHASHPLEGTLGEQYLCDYRGLQGPFPPSLRFIRSTEHPCTGLLLPALVAALSRSDGHTVAIQLTFLRPVDGRKNPSSTPRINVGKFGTGAVRLEGERGQAEIDNVIGLAEGIETALSAQQLSRIPVWATLNAQRLRTITLPKGLREVHIFADNDKPGQVAAERAATRYSREGLTVKLRSPPEVYGDWNDYLVARGASR